VKPHLIKGKFDQRGNIANEIHGMNLLVVEFIENCQLHWCSYLGQWRTRILDH
jgi:hypothetical protein